MYLKLAALTIGSAVAFTALAEESEPEKEAFFNNGELVLEEDGKVTRFVTPREFADSARFVLRIKREKKEEPIPVVEETPPSLAERIEARKIMHEANQAYLKGELERTWELVAAAEQLDPDFYRIKTVKGSLLYKIGSRELAIEIWQESLRQNPDQPEIVQMIKKLGGPKTIAKDLTQDKKDALR